MTVIVQSVLRMCGCVLCTLHRHITIHFTPERGVAWSGIDSLLVWTLTEDGRLSVMSISVQTTVAWQKNSARKSPLSPYWMGFTVLACLCGVLMVAVVGWAMMAYVRRKRMAEEFGELKTTKSNKMLTKSMRVERKKAKDERRKEASFLRMLNWLQQLQILEHAQKSRKPDSSVHALLRDDSGTFTLNYIELKEETARLMAMRPQCRRSDQYSMGSIREMREQPDVMAYIRSIGDEMEEEREVQRDDGQFIFTISGCRHERIGIRRDTAVTLNTNPNPKQGGIRIFVRPRERIPQDLHMNKFKDYYGNDLILCQAPMPAQFADQWQAIWEQNVGVLVWIGDFVELGRQKIDPYISLKEGGQVIWDEYKVQTLFVARFKDEFDVYRVGATFELARNDDYRELIVIHVHMWPDHRIPDEPAQLADLVAQVQGHQLKQATRGLSTLIVHCSLGVQRSPAFLAAYIGRQMWMTNRRANVHGIMRYIRRKRWRAFAYGDPFAQVQIVFGVVQVFAMRLEMEGIANLNVALEEEGVFDQGRSDEEAIDSSSTS